MNAPWTTHTLAGELLDVLRLLGRMITHHARTIDEKKATFLQVRALFLLIEHPLTVSMLAKKRGVSLQAASSLVQGLVERGWVTRTPDPNDRRQSLLEVTPEGLARAQLANDQMSSYLARSLDELSPEEIAAASMFPMMMLIMNGLSLLIIRVGASGRLPSAGSGSYDALADRFHLIQQLPLEQPVRLVIPFLHGPWTPSVLSYYHLYLGRHGSLGACSFWVNHIPR